MTQITLKNSQFGVVNSGTIKRINAAITVTKGTDAETIGRVIQEFGSAVIATRALDAKQQGDIIDLLQTLADQVVGPRKRSVMGALASTILAGVSHVSELAAAAEQLRELVQGLLPHA